MFSFSHNYDNEHLISFIGSPIISNCFFSWIKCDSYNKTLSYIRHNRAFGCNRYIMITAMIVSNQSYFFSLETIKVVLCYSCWAHKRFGLLSILCCWVLSILCCWGISKCFFLLLSFCSSLSMVPFRILYIIFFILLLLLFFFSSFIPRTFRLHVGLFQA